ncbi:MAG: tetratricopeptide repeat protein [Thermomicrobium sp.]|nr:tetratricopeptide repeat protein [Thermomicrobium sp.]
MSTIPLAEAVERVRRAVAAGQLAEAKRMLRAIRSVAPEAVATHRIWGEVLLEEDPSAAERVLARAITVDPEDADSWRAMAEAFWRRGEREAARACLQVAWECAPWRRELAERLTEWYRGEEEGGQLFPSSPALSAWYLAQGWWTRCAEECRAALERVGPRWDLRQRYCLALWWLGAREEAGEEAERLLAERPELVGALAVAALAARERGDDVAARRYRELLWALDPSGEVVERCVSPEQWEARGWLGVPEPVLVEEAWLVAGLEETELLWELPTDEELEAARPTASDEGEAAVASAEVEGAAEFREFALEEVGEGVWAVGTVPAEAELGALEDGETRREALEPGWTGLLEEAGTAVEFAELEELAEAASAVAEEETEPVVREVVAAAWSFEEMEGARRPDEGSVEEPTPSTTEATVGGEREAVPASGAARAASEELDRWGDSVEEFHRLVAEGESARAARLAQRIVHENPDAAVTLVPELERMVSEGKAGARQAAMALGALYRRRGETARAARLYELALRLRAE